MKKSGMGLLCIAVAASLGFSLAAGSMLRDLEVRVKNCEAQLRGITECVNDCATEIEKICAELEKGEDDGK